MYPKAVHGLLWPFELGNSVTVIITGMEARNYIIVSKTIPLCYARLRSFFSYIPIYNISLTRKAT